MRYSPLDGGSKELKFQINSLNSPLSMGTASVGIMKILKGLFLRETYSTTLDIYEGMEEESEPVEEDILYTKETFYDEDGIEREEEAFHREVRGRIKIEVSVRLNS